MLLINYILCTLSLLMLCFVHIELVDLDICEKLSPYSIKILEPSNELKVWLGSEVTISCCSRKQTRDNSVYFEDDFESSSRNGQHLIWLNPKGEKILNYFSNPANAEKNGEFLIPDNRRGVEVIHLIIKNFTEQDNGQYRCNFDTSGSAKAAEISVKGYPKVVIDAEKIQYLQEGHPGNIICNPRGHPKIDVVWFFNNEHLQPAQHKFSFLNNHRVLSVRKATLDLAGTYLCKAEVYNTGSNYGSYIEVQPIKVVIFQPPEISATSPIVESNSYNGISAFEDGALKIACDIRALPRPKVIWYHNGVLLNLTENPRMFIKENVYYNHLYSMLIIEPVQIKDMGVYSCNASIGDGSFLKSVSKNVTPEFAFHPRFIDALTHLNESVSPGQNSVLNCTVYGARTTRMSVSFVRELFASNEFMKGQKQYINSTNNNPRLQFTMFPDPENDYITHIQMNMNDIRPSDAGYYYCRAAVQTGLPIISYQLSKIGQVNVFTMPSLLTSHENKVSVQYGLWYKPNTLKCKVKSFPLPTWQWQFRNYNINQDNFQQYEIETVNKNDSSISKLIIKPNYLNDAIFGIYTCTATNRMGSDSLQISFRQASRPGPPKLSICKLTSTTIQLCVSPNNDTGGMPLTHYELRIKEFEQQSQQYHGPYYYPVSPSRITLSHLKSATGYNLALSAASEAGRGANTYIGANTKPIGTPVVELVNTSNAPDWNAFNLRWNLESDGGLPITSYDVKIQQVRVDSSTGKVIDRIGPQKNYSIDDLSQIRHVFRVNSLYPHTWYELRFQVSNMMGPSMVQEVVFRTLDPPPSFARSESLLAPWNRAAKQYGKINYLVQFTGLVFILFVLSLD